jgi:homoserine O-acetyltransferase/O-succinyltransferase
VSRSSTSTAPRQSGPKPNTGPAGTSAVGRRHAGADTAQRQSRTDATTDTAVTQRVVLYAEDDPLTLANGRALAPVQVAYETYGELDAERANAVFLCHALTGSAHAAAPDGWWRTLVGPGLAVDTDRFFVICPNLLGGCSGTTGPSSPDPATGNAYGLDFPPLAVTDLVAVHRRLLEHLEIDTLHAAIGGSLGGMQVLQWLLDAPGQIARAGIVAASSRLSAQNLAFSAATRHAILSDPAFHSGAYALYSTRPSRGLSTARRVGHITYLSEASMEARFARPPEPDPAPPTDAREWLSSRYPVETYLDHQADAFLARFDALSYLWLSRVMDGFDPFAAPSTRAPAALDPAARALVLSFSSDWRFGAAHSLQIAEGLRRRGGEHVTELEIESALGHDSFLLKVPGYQDAIARFLDD